MSEVSFRGIEKRFDSSRWRCARSTSTCPTARSSCCSARRAAARRRRCASSPASSCRPPGTVHIGDRDVTRLQPRDRDVAMVFQSYALYPHMTVAENIGYPLRIRGLSKREQRAAPSNGRGVARDRPPARPPAAAALGRPAPAHRAGAGDRARARRFLMDEPLSNLDAKLRTSMRGEIKRLQKRLGTTTLYVTHDQAEALTMADLVAVMREGELQQLAPPDEIYDRPANRFVADVRRQPADERPRRARRRRRASFVVGDQRLAARRRGSRCLRGRRRDGARRAARGPRARRAADTPGALPGEIYVVEPMGNETLVDVRVGEQRVIGAGRPRIHRADRLADRRARRPWRARASSGRTARRCSTGATVQASEGRCPHDDTRCRPRARLRASTRSAAATCCARRRRRRRARRRAAARQRRPSAPQATAPRPPPDDGKKLVIGAFAGRRASTPFKEKIIPLVKKETGITIQFLQDAVRLVLREVVRGRPERRPASTTSTSWTTPGCRSSARRASSRTSAQHGIDGRRRLRQAVHRPGLLAAAPGPARQGLRERRSRRSSRCRRSATCRP